jgi:hypothetical protein
MFGLQNLVDMVTKDIEAYVNSLHIVQQVKANLNVFMGH